MNMTAAATANTPQRRYDLDWLRVLTILTVFVFHSMRFFDTGGWHVKNGVNYGFVDIITSFLAEWMMPIIFVISGASLFYAMSKGGFGKFMKDKVLRLVIPLVIGIFTHAILQVYLERISHGQFTGSFFDFLPHYFEGLYAFGGNFAWMGLHLWYLLVLFVYSLLLYPLFRLLKSAPGARALNGLCSILALPGAVYLLALPIAVLWILLDPGEPWGMRDMGGWSIVIYLCFFVYGFLLISHAGLQRRIQQQRWISLALGLATLAAMIVINTGSDPAYGTGGYALLFGLYSIGGWFWILVILGFGMRHLTRNTPFLQYTNEAVLPFYVLHQTVLLCVGFFVVRWAIPDLLKYIVIAATSFSLIATIYELLVRRSNLLRFLFGMKLMKRVERPHHEAMPQATPAAR